MKLNEASTLARHHMDAHGLHDWSVVFDRARLRFGRCVYKAKRIQLSRYLVELNDEAHVLDTILHEIAHAVLPPGAGHGLVWQRKAREIGCNARACYETASVTMVPGKYQATCATCGFVAHAYKRRKRRTACSTCCRAYSGGRFDEKYLLVFKPI